MSQVTIPDLPPNSVLVGTELFEISNSLVSEKVTLDQIQTFLNTWVADQDASGFDLLNVGRITINNPSDTFQYVITPAVILADRILNLPLLISTDTFVTEAHIQTLTNKSIDAANNTLTNIDETMQIVDTGISGTILTSNGVGVAPTYQAAAVTGIVSLNADSAAAQTLTGGTGIDIIDSTPDHSFAIDSTVVTLTGSQTLTNKTIDGDLNTIVDINETQMNVSVGASGFVLTSNGVGLAPTYQAGGFSGNLSDLVINADKDWLGNDITNLGLVRLLIDNATAILELEANHTTPTAAQVISQIDMYDDDAGNNRTLYAQIQTIIADPTSFDESATIFFNVNSQNNLLTFMTMNPLANLGRLQINVDIDMDSNGILNVDEIDFNSSPAPSASNANIHQNGGTMRINVATGEFITLAFQGTTQYFFTATEVDLTGSFLTDAGRLTMLAGSLEFAKGADVASPAGGLMTLPQDGNVYDITGTNTINEIVAASWQAGSTVILQFDAALTVSNNSGGTNDILLAGGVDFVVVAGNTLTLFYNGADWVEVARSAAGASTNSISDGNSDITVTDAGTGSIITTLDGTPVHDVNLIRTFIDNRFSEAQGTSTNVSSNSLTWPNDGNYILSSGTNGLLETINTVDWQSGSIIYLRFDAFSTNDIVHNDAGSGNLRGLFLKERANHVDVSTDDVFAFMFDSATNTWREIWNTLPAAGDVVGPASSTNNAIARFDLATGKLIQNSVVTLGDLGELNDVGLIDFTPGPTEPAGSTTYIWNDAGGIVVNVPTGDTVAVAINSNEIYTFGADNLNFLNRDIAAIGLIEFGSGLAPVSGATSAIWNSTTLGLAFNIPTGDEYRYFINNVEIFSLSASTLDGAGAGGVPKLLQNFDSIQLSKVSNMELRFGATTSAVSTIIGTINWKADQSDAGLVDYCRIEGETALTTDATAAGRMDLMCLEDGDANPIPYITLRGQLDQIEVARQITMASQPILLLGSTQYSVAGVTPAGTIAYIKKVTTDFLFNVPSAHEIHFTYNGGVADYTFTTSVMDITGAQIQNCNILFSNAGAALVATTGFIRMGNDQFLGWRNAGDTDNHTITFNTTDEFEIAINGVTADYLFSATVLDMLGKPIEAVSLIQSSFQDEILIFGNVSSAAVNEITITNAITLTRPIIAASGDDTNVGLEFRVKAEEDIIFTNDGSEETLQLTQVAGAAVNFVEITNAVTTTGPIIAAVGTNTNVDLNLRPKGAGDVNIGNATTEGLSFYGQTARTQGAALTAADTTITFTAPGTPDFAIQDLTTTTPFGFVTSDEAQTVLQVIANLQARVNELEARLDTTSGVGLIAG